MNCIVAHVQIWACTANVVGCMDVAVVRFSCVQRYASMLTVDTCRGRPVIMVEGQCTGFLYSDPRCRGFIAGTSV